MNEEKLKQIEDIQAELRCLHSDLQFSGEFGDWKIAKIYEYTLTGKESPYDINELSAKRQEVRNRINELEEQLKEIERG